jgi:hypothetical protein
VAVQVAALAGVVEQSVAVAEADLFADAVHRQVSAGL